MFEFLAITTSLPAAPFAAALVLVVGYWVVAIVSGIDLGADGTVDGAADAAIEAVTSLDTAAETVESAVDDLLAAPEVAGPPPLFTKLTGLGQVPVTVWLSLFAVWGWLLAFGLAWLARHPLAGVVPDGLVRWGGLAVAVVVAAGLAGRTARPLAPMFRTGNSRERAALVGEVAEITTGRVDARFGQARIQIGGDELVVQVRNDRADNGLARGSKALVVGFDPRREAYVVEPLSPEG